MIPGLIKLFKNFQKLQGEIKKIQEDLVKEEVIGSSGAGMVEATVNGKLEVVDIKIDKKLLEDKNVQMLQDLIAAAVNDAMRKAQERIKEKFGEIGAGMGFADLGSSEIFDQNQ